MQRDRSLNGVYPSSYCDGTPQDHENIEEKGCPRDIGKHSARAKRLSHDGKSRGRTLGTRHQVSGIREQPQASAPLSGTKRAVRSILLSMKKLIFLGVLAAIAAVLYKVLTTEIPINNT